MLRCWSCAHPFQQKLVSRDGLIKGREQESGGPYRLYSCPACHKPSMVEVTPAGRYFASPYKDISLMDFLFGWIQPITPTDYLKILEWQRNFGARRRHFFERDGDSRYSSGLLMSWLEKLLPGVEETEPPRRPSSQQQQSHSEEDTPQPRFSNIPHPYRILEVSPNASAEEIRSAFQRLARQWHPDKIKTRDPKILEQASRRLSQLIEAYEELRSKNSS